MGEDDILINENEDVSSNESTDSLTESETDIEESAPVVSVESPHTVYFYSQPDYLGVSHLDGYYLVPDTQLVYADMTDMLYDEENQYWYCSITHDNAVELALYHNLEDNIAMNRMMVMMSCIQAMILLILCVPKLKEFGRRLIGRKKGDGV